MSPKFWEMVSVIVRARNKIYEWSSKKAATLGAVQYGLCSWSTQNKTRYMLLSLKLEFFLFEDGFNLVSLGLPNLDKTTLGVTGI